jgi:hypothetical protein
MMTDLRNDPTVEAFMHSDDVMMLVSELSARTVYPGTMLNVGLEAAGRRKRRLECCAEGEDGNR